MRRLGRQLDFEITVGEQLAQPSQLKVDDAVDLGARQPVEDDDVVDAVQELGPEGPPHLGHDRGLGILGSRARDHVRQNVTADVRRHDDDGVAEVDGAALAVGQAPVVEQLQQAC